MLQEIRKRVQEKVKNSPEIIIRAYRSMMKKHSGCSCEYCQSRAKYVNAILLMRSDRRRYEDGSEDMDDEFAWRRYQDSKLRVHNLKVQRDLMKQL